MCCDKCGSSRIMSVSGKTSDMCSISFSGRDTHGYVPAGIGLGGGDYLKIDVCMACGKMQGKYPVDDDAMIEAMDEQAAS
jgi:hypothetical protein